MKRILTLLFLLVFASSLFSSEPLVNILSMKDWSSLEQHFTDDSYHTLRKHFAEAKEIKLTTYVNEDKLTYRVKFNISAELGTIVYEYENGKYSKLKIVNTIKPLFFISHFNAYKIKNKHLEIGEARIQLKKGIIYASKPFTQFLFFRGKWEFSVTPSDPEERITLSHMINKETYSESGNWLILQVDASKFLKGMAVMPQKISKSNPVVAKMMEVYNKTFGIFIKKFNEHWYLTYNKNNNTLLYEKEKKRYIFNFNESNIPDTNFFSVTDRKIILSYNSVKTMKMSFGKEDRTKKLQLSLFYNPGSNFLSGTSVLTFEQQQALRSLSLNPKLKIRGSLSKDNSHLSVMRKRNTYYFLGESTDKLSFFFDGQVNPGLHVGETFKEHPGSYASPFFYLSRNQNFYPNTGIDFSETVFTVSVPPQMNCLASGTLSRSTQSSRNTFTFTSPGVKGISLICGNFNFLKKLDSKIPIKVFGAPRSAPLRFYNRKEIIKGFNYLIDRLEPLGLKEVNMVFQPSSNEGGVSTQGLIVIDYNFRGVSVDINRRVNAHRSPILLGKASTYYIIHELAHQWWGGIISWKSYKDIWITEGLSQFSELMFLEHHFSSGRFRRMLNRMKRHIYQYNDNGPIIYGNRILGSNDKRTAFQTIVYNKTAVVFLMLKNLLGEAEFLKRLNTLIHTHKYSSINTATFVKTFSKGNPLVTKFLNSWIRRRHIPEIDVNSRLQNNKAVVSVTQDSDFVFPLTLTIETADGRITRTFIIDEPSKKIVLNESSRIILVKPDMSASLVKLKKNNGR